MICGSTGSPSTQKLWRSEYNANSPPAFNDVSFFKHHRTVEHRDGSSETKLAPVKKTIYSLSVVAGLFRASNRRYLEFLSVWYVQWREIEIPPQGATVQSAWQATLKLRFSPPRSETGVYANAAGIRITSIEWNRVSSQVSEPLAAPAPTRPTTADAVRPRVEATQ